MLKLLYQLFVIILCTVIGGGVGYGLSYSQTERWMVSAQLELPAIASLGNYYSLSSTYNFLTINANQNTNTQIASKDIVVEVYDEFKRHLVSSDLLLNYLEQTEIVKLKAQLENKSAITVANELSTRFSFKKDSQIQADNISFVLENPEDAKKILGEFIVFANKHARDKLNADLITKWKVLFQNIKKADELNLGANRDNQDWSAKLQMMRSVQPLDDTLIAYRLVKSPMTSMEPISPNRLLWLLIGALSGLLFGFILSFKIKLK